MIKQYVPLNTTFDQLGLASRIDWWDFLNIVISLCQTNPTILVGQDGDTGPAPRTSRTWLVSGFSGCTTCLTRGSPNARRCGGGLFPIHHVWGHKNRVVCMSYTASRGRGGGLGFHTHAGVDSRCRWWYNISKMSLAWRGGGDGKGHAWPQIHSCGQLLITIVRYASVRKFGTGLSEGCV